MRAGSVELREEVGIVRAGSVELREDLGILRWVEMGEVERSVGMDESRFLETGKMVGEDLRF